MRISARNQIKGTVVEVKKGATTSHVRVDIGGGQIMTSSITNEAVDELGIKAKGACHRGGEGLRRHDRGGLIMRTALLIALVLLGTAPAWAAEEPSGCDKFKWNIDRERAALTAPDRVKLASGAELAALPSTGSDAGPARTRRGQAAHAARTRAEGRHLRGLCGFQEPAEGRHLHRQPVRGRLGRSGAGRPFPEAEGVSAAPPTATASARP